MAANLNKVRQIAVYAPHVFYRKMQKEAEARNRSVGATALEILKEYFDKKEKTQDVRNGIEQAQ